jgi:GAF domain-containing protein
MDPQSLRRGLDRLTQLFLRDVAVGEALQAVADLARFALDATDAVGITWLREGRPTSAKLAGRPGATVDTSALDVADGPGLAACADQVVCRIETIDGDSRWPAFSKMASSLGVCSTLAAPLVAGRESVGALNLYSRAGGFTAADEGVIDLFTHQAGIALANCHAYWEARKLNDHLTEAMQSRAAIEQAKGILMAAGGRSPDDAFNILVRASQRENRKLRDLALEIVQRVQKQPTGSNIDHVTVPALE